jgi:hypothetical protein
MSARIIRIAYTGGPFDGSVEDFEASGQPPQFIKRPQPASMSFADFRPEDEPPIIQTGITEYQRREGPGLIGRTGDGAWLYDYVRTS